MNFTNEFIDRIVDSVMRELASPGPSESSRCDGLPPDSGQLPELRSSVITEEVLTAEGIESGRIVIPPGAVITPSGRDYLQRRGIEIATTAKSSHRMAQEVSATGVAVFAKRCHALAAAATSAGLTIARADCAVGLARRAACSAADEQQSLTCCSQPSVTACLINRNTARRKVQ